MGVDLAADGGQSGLRMAVVEHGGDRPAPGQTADVPGFAWAAGADLATAQCDALLRAWRALGSPAPVGTLACGLSGLGVESPAVDQLLTQLAAATGARRVVVTGDDVTTHAGALGGEPGVVLNAGTGVVCTSVDPGGAILRMDAWGYLLGDAGGGSWLGREGLRAALAGLDGRHRATALTAAAVDRYGELRAFVHRVLASPTMVTDVAAFARDVLACADAGDQVAAHLRDLAVDELVATVTATVRQAYQDVPAGTVPFTWTGSILTATETVRTPLLAALATSCQALTVREPAAGGLAGAAWLAGNEGTAHHAHCRELHPT